MNQRPDMQNHRIETGENLPVGVKSKRQLNSSLLVMFAWLAFVMLAILLAVVQVVM